jgi:hypothetical protein
VDVTLAVVGFIIVGFFGKRAGWFKIIAGTNSLLRLQVAAQEKTIALSNQAVELLKEQLTETRNAHEVDKKNWEAHHNESLQLISKLEGKIDIISTIPLRDIDASLQSLGISNKAIVTLLTTQLEREQTVADKVTQVKVDLATH